MNRRSTKFYRKNEKEVMKRLGFRPTKNSGAGWIEKEDGQNEQYICQLKSTDKQSISIKQNDLHILEQNAAVSHKLPVFAFQFLNTDEVWVAVRESDVEEFKRILREEKLSRPKCFGNYIIYKCDRCFFCRECKKETETLDETEEICYNKGEVGKTYLARQKYRRQRMKEKEEQERKYKQRMKEKNRERRKRQIGKEV